MDGSEGGAETAKDGVIREIRVVGCRIWPVMVPKSNDCGSASNECRDTEGEVGIIGYAS
jgi:hypothetical protein